MSKYFKYIGYVIFFVLGWLMSSQCNRVSCPPCPEVVEYRVDTLVNSSVDTFYKSVPKYIPYVEYREVLKVDTVALAATENPAHASFTEYYEDSTYLIESNLLYDGTLIGFDQALHTLKDKFVEVVITDTVRIKEQTTLMMPPRRILSLGVIAQISSPEAGIGVSASYMDRKRRSFDVGYLANINQWQAGIKLPIWSR